ncbi:hypothetical protein DSO57_1011681 [Entomophthora muscae]|uniref:Uncharacterized protein n=1 Tax=Entomophthora muscae TaxID=34485 RepID=A0ACC2RX92_9FUNG|nr:hypothetical protein DSO57_1011681 [Entomophthora muscae]
MWSPVQALGTLLADPYLTFRNASFDIPDKNLVIGIQEVSAPPFGLTESPNSQWLIGKEANDKLVNNELLHFEIESRQSGVSTIKLMDNVTKIDDTDKLFGSVSALACLLVSGSVAGPCSSSPGLCEE